MTQRCLASLGRNQNTKSREGAKQRRQKRSGGSKMCGAKMGETPKDGLDVLIIRNVFPSLLSSRLR